MALPKDIARDLLPIVNNAEYETIYIYVNYRIEQLRKEMETVSPDGLKNLQGALSEIKKLLTLREQVQQDSK